MATDPTATGSGRSASVGLDLMVQVPRVRPTSDQYFIQMAMNAATRSTCHRRQVGCVIVNKAGHVMATGYNGVCAGAAHCEGSTKCPGADQPSGEGLHLCEAIHAEVNALMQCHDITEIDTIYTTASPCVHCMRLIRNTSTKRIVFAEEYPHAESAIIARRGKIAWEQYQGPRANVPELSGGKRPRR